jgi:hypothetical protein
LPRLQDLLAESAGHGPGGLTSDDLEEFRGKLAGLLPASFTPQGSGPMKVLVSYPAAAPNPSLAQYLRQSVRLPNDAETTLEFRNTATESISVVLFRSSMGITEVREVRGVLLTWAEAQTTPRPFDYLRWRQRTGYDFGYLATTEEHRVQILHRFLCAIWNGRVRPEGDPASPLSVSVELGGVRMTLPLTPLEDASSWAELLRSYELWTISDNEDIRRQFCAQLMQEFPDRLDSRPSAPHKLYLLLRDMADGQVAKLDAMLADDDPVARLEAASAGRPSRSRPRARQLRDFWARTLPAALDLEFVGIESIRPNLRALEVVVQRWEAGH